MNQPEPESPYEATLRVHRELQDRALHGRVVVKPADRPVIQGRQGKLRYYLNRDAYHDTVLKDWNVFVHEIHQHSGKHVHQGGVAIFVIEGEGYTIMDGERVEWKAGDMILLPIKPGGVEHQHFNKDPNRPVRWIAFAYKPFHDEVASVFEQRETSPDYLRKEGKP